MNSFKKITTVSLAVIFSIIFWNEKFGINLFLFSSLLTAISLYQNRKSLHSSMVKITLAGTLISGITVVILNSFISKFAHITSFWLMISFIHYPHLRSLYYSIQYSFTNLVMAQKEFFVSQIMHNKPTSRSGMILHNLKLIVFPFIALIIFYILFYNANDKFASLADSFCNQLYHVFSNIFEYISFGRFFMIIFGVLIVVFSLYRSQLISDDSLLSDTLKRVRVKRRGRVFDPLNILKQQYKTAVILVLSVNVLLIIVNGIDISWIWINFTVPEGMVLKHFVHEGTYLLIVSILLSMAIILWFFRNNLNFYPNNHFLKVISLIWMGQNIILCISVFLRNYHYINYHGLAYKRIGVIIFLVLTVVGLMSMITKISKTRSSYFMVRTNTLAAYFMLIVMACINWDIMIARFNLSHWNKSGIDVDFYFTVSPKAIPLLNDHLNVIDEQIKACNAAHTNYTSFNNIHLFKKQLRSIELEYIREQQTYSFLSWNVSDYQTMTGIVDTEN